MLVDAFLKKHLLKLINIFKYKRLPGFYIRVKEDEAGGLLQQDPV